MSEVTRIPITEGQKRWQKYRKPRLGEYKASRPEIVMRHYHRVRSRAFMFLGGRCEECGNDDMRVLELDHALNNGLQERRSMGTSANSTSVLRRVFRAPGDYRLLCANCHRIRHFTDKERSRAQVLTA